MNKVEALAKVRGNIANFGHHIYVVAGGPNPRFSYSIGLREAVGMEVILAGSSFYSTEEVGNVIDGIAKILRSNNKWQNAKFILGDRGVFSLSTVHSSWSSRLLLGILDFYNISEVPTLQISPDAEHWTIDVPDLSAPWNSTFEPCWQWLDRSWNYSVPKSSIAVTNIDALQGEPVTEAMRWEESEWELFAGSGPDTDRDKIRTVPLGTILGADPSLAPIAELGVGKGLWRDPGGEWQRWGHDQ